MWGNIARTVALLIGVGYVTAAAVAWGAGAVRVGILVAMALALIWFPEEIGGHTTLRINSPTPPIVVSLFGWFFLVGMPAILYLIWR
jgi:hypothetical protein